MQPYGLQTHTIPVRGRVYVCVAINTVSPSHSSKPHSTHPSLYRRGVLSVCWSWARCGRDNAPHRSHEALSRLGQCPHTNQPRLLQPIIANVRPALGCVHAHSSRTPAIALPQHVLVPVRCIVFRFRFYFGFIFRIFVSVSVLLSALVNER